MLFSRYLIRRTTSSLTRTIGTKCGVLIPVQGKVRQRQSLPIQSGERKRVVALAAREIEGSGRLPEHRINFSRIASTCYLGLVECKRFLSRPRNRNRRFLNRIASIRMILMSFVLSDCFPVGANRTTAFDSAEDGRSPKGFMRQWTLLDRRDVHSIL